MTNNTASELSDSGYATCTVHDLLTMTSGVDRVEDHRDPDSPASRLSACFRGNGRTTMEAVSP